MYRPSSPQEKFGREGLTESVDHEMPNLIDSGVGYELTKIFVSNI